LLGILDCPEDFIEIFEHG
jgi:hypothetical protein